MPQMRTWDKLPDGTYKERNTGQIINPALLTPDQARNMGLPQEAAVTASQGSDSKQATPQVAPPQPVPQAEGDLLNFYGSKDPGINLFQSIYGNNPLDYYGTVKKGYENIGQPLEENKGVAANAVLGLAKPYIDTVLKQTGKLPTEEEVKQFVAGNFDVKFAEDFITGGTNYDQIIARKVLPHLEEKKLTSDTGTGQAQEEIGKGIEGLNDLNEQLFQAAKGQTIRDVDEAYIPQKRGLVEDLAAQGQLGQRNSRYSLDALEAAKSKGLSQALGNVAVQRAQGGLDIGKTAQTLLANQRGLAQQARQYGLDFGLRRQMLNKDIDDSAYNRGLQRQQMQLAGQLGRQQAQASEPGWMDYLGLGFQGLGALGSLGSGLGAARTAFK